MMNDKKDICEQMGSHRSHLTNKCSYSSKERNVAICKISLSLVGLFLISVRIVAITQYSSIEQIFFLSNFIALMTSIALVTQLKVFYLNAIVAISTPVVICILFVDLYYMIMLSFFSLWILTIHLPTSIVGVFILIKRYDMLRLIPLTMGFFTALTWSLLVDFRISEISFILGVIFIFIATSGILAYDLYRNGAINGTISPSICEC